MGAESVYRCVRGLGSLAAADLYMGQSLREAAANSSDTATIDSRRLRMYAHTKRFGIGYTSTIRRIGGALWFCGMLVLGSATTSVNAETPKWGAFKADSCTSVGKRQFSSRLWDIPGGNDWKSECRKMPATIVDGAGRSHNFETPSRCIDLGAGGMWGEFDVPDTSCAPKWGQIRKDACRGIGIRQYSAVLENIPAGMSWDEACKQTGAEITNDYGTVQRFDKPNECVQKVNGQWGEFFVSVSDCSFDVVEFEKAMEKAKPAFSEQCMHDVFLSNYSTDQGARRYKSDGCSAPVGDPLSIVYKDVFFKACVVHDTCYTLPWKDKVAGKQVCDQVFEVEANAACAPMDLVCKNAAATWAGIVRIRPEGGGR